MRKWLLILVMGVLFVFPSFAFAQDESCNSICQCKPVA